ncbi:hypothetical protein MHM83_07800 [Tenacibaculum sp. Mcav3-52]|uniref:hypothetical protein n=1 Tax=Tenacibaculum sp. Mcav3-52 TaxID=2917762 RepID=UPI001EF2D62C|nr:hypothetical protein [Tenacibaculum sp. Mcav3-52]MCG7501772.1 hypothetical protein [Tenacibaculum sp. Mcav3-52]
MSDNEVSLNGFSPDELKFLGQSNELIRLNDTQKKDFFSISFAIRVGVILNLKLLKKFNNLEFDSLTRNEVINLLEKCNESSDQVNELIMDAYRLSNEKNLFWTHCSLSTYQHYFEELKSRYLSKYDEANVLDFLKHEYTYFIKNTRKEKYRKVNRIHSSIEKSDLFIMTDYYRVINYETEEFLRINNQKKLDFISNEIYRHGYIIQLAKSKKEVFINLIPVSETNDFDALDEIVLSKSQLPNFSLFERYIMLEQLGYVKKINDVTGLKKSKNKLLAIIMNCSVDNARKLLDGTYKVKNKELNKERKLSAEKEIQEFFKRNEIII